MKMNQLPTIPDLDADFTEFVPDEHLDAIRQRFLTKLEALAVEAIATGNWNKVSAHIFDFCHDQHGAFINIGIGENL